MCTVVFVLYFYFFPFLNKHVLPNVFRPAPMSVYNGILRSYFLLGTKINFASNNDEKIVYHIICFHAITSCRRKWISASCRYQQNLAQNYLVIP